MIDHFDVHRSARKFLLETAQAFAFLLWNCRKGEKVGQTVQRGNAPPGASGHQLEASSHQKKFVGVGDWRRGFAQQEWEPIRGRPAVRGKRTYDGRLGQRVEEQGTWASRTQKRIKAGYGQPVDRGAWTAKTVKRPRQQPAHPQCANYWAPLTCKWHTMPHSAQPQHANYWAP